MRTLKIAALLVSLTSSAVLAQDLKGESCPVTPTLKSGWYIGMQAGYDSYRSRNHVNVPDPLLTSDVPNFDMRQIYNSTGWVGGLFFGYGMKLTNWFYLGGEAFANESLANVDTSITIPTGTTYTYQLQVNGSYGIGVLPGIFMTDSTLTFIRLGLNRANLRTTETLTSLSPSYDQSTLSHNTTGYVFGVGMETLTAENWSLRAEFDHIWYDAFKTKAPFRTSIHAADNQMMLAMLYHFA